MNSISPTQTQSSPFSISDILSKDTGQKKSPTTTTGHQISLSTPSSNGVSRTPGRTMFGQENANKMKLSNAETPKRPRKFSTSHLPSRNPKISLSEMGTMVAPSSTMAYSGHHENLMIQGQHPPSKVTPHKPLRSSQMNTSFVSPFNANILQAIGQRPSPSREEKEELFGDGSLGMLSEVAQYHSELSGAEGNSSVDTPMQDRLANIRLISTADISDCGPHEASKGEARNASLVLGRHRKTSTPSILKRDKKRKRILSAPHSSTDEPCEHTPSKPLPPPQPPQQQHQHQQGPLNQGFLSPLAHDKSSHNLTFSPSIFLSRPDTSHSVSPPDRSQFHSRTTSASIPFRKPESSMVFATPTTSSLASRFSTSPGSESDNVHSISSDGGTDSEFVTSTPIKSGKENLIRSDNEEAWSPTILLNSKRRKHLRETNEHSSGSESAAVKKPCLHPPSAHRGKKSKARTKLSPLLENACSPISKDSSAQHHPSPLLSTALSTSTTIPTYPAVINTPASSSFARSSSCGHTHQRAPPMPATMPPSLPPSASSSSSHPHLPPPTRPNLLGPGGLMVAGMAARAAPLAGHKILNTATPTISLNQPFPAMSALLPSHQPRPLLSQNPQLSCLPGGFSYGQLVPNSPLGGAYTSGIVQPTVAGGISYLSLMRMGLMTAPPTPPVHNPTMFLSSYSGNDGTTYNTTSHPPHPPHVRQQQHVAAMNSSCDSGVGSMSYSRMVLDESGNTSSRRGDSSKQPLQSVPPWFIFSNNRSEKRSRLTEAINKSISEAPSQTTKLPAEWTKLACGQTKDQKHMTEKARIFMQCRPRHLTFSEDTEEV